MFMLSRGRRWNRLEGKGIHLNEPLRRDHPFRISPSSYPHNPPKRCKSDHVSSLLKASRDSPTALGAKSKLQGLVTVCPSNIFSHHPMVAFRPMSTPLRFLECPLLPSASRFHTLPSTLHPSLLTQHILSKVPL